jgi:hypothetical protein
VFNVWFKAVHDDDFGWKICLPIDKDSDHSPLQ